MPSRVIALGSHHRGAAKYQYWSSWTGLGGWRDKQNGCIVSATRYYLACCPPPFPLGLSASFSSSIVANCDSPKISSHHSRLRPPINTKSTTPQHPVGTDTRASTKSNGHWRSGRESGVCQAGACVHSEQRAASTLNQKEADLGSHKFGNL